MTDSRIPLTVIYALQRVRAPRWFVRFSWDHPRVYGMRDRWYNALNRRIYRRHVNGG